MTNDMSERFERTPSPERESQKPVLLIYRENALYDATAQMIEESLVSLGRRVEVVHFPKETTEEEIAAWCEEHGDAFRGKELLSDYTCGRYQDSGTGCSVLDQLHDCAVVSRFVGQDCKRYYEAEESLSPEAIEAAFKSVFQRILQEAKVPIEEVLIVGSKLYEHAPFSRESFFGEKLEAEFEELGLVAEERQGKPLLDESGELIKYPELEKRKHAALKKINRAASEIVRQWLISAGMSEEKLHITDELTPKTEEKHNQPDRLIIGDRHYLRGGGNSDKIETVDQETHEYSHRAKLLQMPIGSFIVSAMHEGLLDVRPEEITDAVREAITKRFAPKAKSRKDDTE